MTEMFSISLSHTYLHFYIWVKYIIFFTNRTEVSTVTEDYRAVSGIYHSCSSGSCEVWHRVCLTFLARLLWLIYILDGQCKLKNNGFT